MSEQKFTVVPTGLLMMTSISLQARFLYAVMSSYGQRGRGSVYPSQESLAKTLGIGARQVRRLLVELEDCGALVKRQEVGQNGVFARNIYELKGFSVSVEDGESTVGHTVPSVMDDRRTYSTVGHVCPMNKNQERENKKAEAAEGGSRRFVPPSVDEVKAFFLGKGASEQSAGKGAEVFVSFYESKGWVVGRVKMKSWRAAAAGWFVRGSDRGEFQLQQQAVRADDLGLF